MAYTIAHLRYVDRVAALGSFSAAAKASGVSQPTVSSAVADFEAEVGSTLFLRTTRGVELTAAGRTMIERVRAVLASAGALEASMGELRDGKRRLLRLAFSPVLDMGALARFVEPYIVKDPQVETVYKECSVDDLRARVDSNQVDVVFAPRIVTRENWKCCRLYSDRLRYIPPGGRWSSSQNTVSLDDVAKNRLLLTKPLCGLAQATRSLFAGAGLEVDTYPGMAMSYGALSEWADLGFGGAILPESKLGDRASSLPVVCANGAPALLSYAAMWNESGVIDAHVRAFIQYLVDQAPTFLRSTKGVWEQPPTTQLASVLHESTTSLRAVGNGGELTPPSAKMLGEA